MICCALLTKASNLGQQYLPIGQRRQLQVANANAALQATIEEIAQTGSGICVCDSLEAPYKVTATPQPADGRRLRSWFDYKKKKNMS